MRGLFITGTDTGVGKTYVGALIARALRAAGKQVGVYKPVASGCRLVGDEVVADDAVTLWEAAGRQGTLDQVCPQRFLAPLAPHRAAVVEGKRVDSRLLRNGLDAWRGQCDIVLVEGAGGLMSPLSDEDYNADLALDLGFPLVVVAANRLGTINATLQTLITASAYKKGSELFSASARRPNPGDRESSSDPYLSVAGVVLNQASEVRDDASVTSNSVELRERCAAPVLATVAWGGQLDERVDWERLAGRG